MESAATQRCVRPPNQPWALKWTAAALLVSILRHGLPLSSRKRLVLRLAKFRPRGFYRLTFLLLEDFSRQDPTAFQKFLWSHHLGHAESYENSRRFGKSNLEPTRLLMLDDLSSQLRKEGIEPRTQVDSVLDVGCSLGHVLRYVETDIFPSASILRGIDIDSYAVANGSEYLRQTASRIALTCGDLSSLGNHLAGKTYDVILCLGVLMYVDERTATQAVRTMLQHVKMCLLVSTWPDPEIDNSNLPNSVPARDVVRNRTDVMDGAWIHNLDRMATLAGGRVVSRRWTGDEVVRGDKPLYYLVVRPEPQPA